MHDGTIIPGEPNRIWGTDATPVLTRTEGMATVFVAIDHFVEDALRGTGADLSGGYASISVNWKGRGAWFGIEYMSHAFRKELQFLGIESNPSFVKAPEGNGVAERFIRTLKEQLLWVQTFDTVEELRQALLDFKARFNCHWLLQRHGYATPAQVRAAHAPVAEAA